MFVLLFFRFAIELQQTRKRERETTIIQQVHAAGAPPLMDKTSSQWLAHVALAEFVAIAKRTFH